MCTQANGGRGSPLDGTRQRTASWSEPGALPLCGASHKVAGGHIGSHAHKRGEAWDAWRVKGGEINNFAVDQGSRTRNSGWASSAQRPGLSPWECQPTRATRPALRSRTQRIGHCQGRRETMLAIPALVSSKYETVTTPRRLKSNESGDSEQASERHRSLSSAAGRPGLSPSGPEGRPEQAGRSLRRCVAA